MYNIYGVLTKEFLIGADNYFKLIIFTFFIGSAHQAYLIHTTILSQSFLFILLAPYI